MNIVAVTDVNNHIPEVLSQPQKAEKKSGKRIGYNYIILKSLKESRKNDVVKCLYIKGLKNFGLCVIKEGSFGETKDKYGRDIKDRLVWQQQLHQLLQDKVRIPRLLGSFEENDNYYLVLEYIRGKSFFSAYTEKNRILRDALINGKKLGLKFLDYLLQIIDILKTLHENQVVHRDVTASNFMVTTRGKIAMIDMELSYSLKDTTAAPYELGTYGYMSPEQLASKTPTIKEDIFSLGALLLQLWTGSISPQKLTEAPIKDITQKVYFFIPDERLANLVIQCLQPGPEFRPALYTIKEVISGFRSDLKRKAKRVASKSDLFSREQILGCIQASINTLSTPLLADEGDGWFSESLNSSLNVDRYKLEKAWYASLNRGAAGIIYFLSQALNVGLDISSCHPHIESGLALIREKYIENINDVSPGLHFASDGIALALAAALQNKLLTPTDKYINWIDLLLEKASNDNNISHGIAGQGMANLYCRQFIKPDKLNERLEKYVQTLLNKQEKEGHWIKQESDNKVKIISGFDNGVAGIICFLLEYGHLFNHASSLLAAEKGLRWLMKRAVYKDNRLSWRSTSGKTLPSTWCEGSTGIGFVFIRAYNYTNNPIYKEFGEKALSNPYRSFLTNSLSQSYGLSGTAEVYLEASRVFNSKIWQDKTQTAVQVIMHLKKQSAKHGPYWLAEEEHLPVANFMIGNTGILHFLLRSCFPDKLHFPLYPVNQL